MVHSDEFGALLREERKRAGRTMADVADLLGLSIVYISDIERGKRAPLDPARVVRVAELLQVGAGPLLSAAARSRGAFELATASVTPMHIEAGAMLMRGWETLTEEDLKSIGDIVRKRIGMEMGGHGFRADRSSSYAALERVAADFRRRHLACCGAPVLDAAHAFEHLDDVDVERANGQRIRLDYAVNDIPVEALTMFDAESGKLVIVLRQDTYRNLLRGQPRARFSVCHEFGHAVLHTEQLIRMAGTPYQDAAMARTPTRGHDVFQDTEWQANGFAAALLMPAIDVVDAVDAGGDVTETVMSRFAVSSDAARRRVAIVEPRRATLLATGRT